MVQEWKILCTLLLVLVTTWTAVFARVRLQYLCYRISLFALSFWVISDYSCVENTNMKIKKNPNLDYGQNMLPSKYSITFNLVMSSNFHKKKWLIGSSLLILEQNFDCNQEKMVRMFSSELKNGKWGDQRFSKVQLQFLFSVLLVL